MRVAPPVVTPLAAGVSSVAEESGAPSHRCAVGRLAGYVDVGLTEKRSRTNAQNEIGVESDQPKDRWSSNPGHSLSRPCDANGSLRRVDAVTGTERATSDGWSGGQNILGPIRCRLPS